MLQIPDCIHAACGDSSLRAGWCDSEVTVPPAVKTGALREGRKHLPDGAAGFGITEISGKPLGAEGGKEKSRRRIFMDYRISKEDGQILRELAKKQLEFHHREDNQRRIREWYDHNALQGQRPMIHLEAATFQQEFLPDRLRCQGEFARQVEQQLYENFQNQELFDDDRVTPDWFGVNYDTYFRLFDIQIHVEHTEMGGQESLGHHFVSVVEDLEDDYEKLKPTVFGVDKESTREKFQSISQTIGDILPVRMKMDCLYSVPTQMIVHFMSMENMMFNMYDYPELFKNMMDRVAEDTLAYYRMLEEEGLILPTVTYV